MFKELELKSTYSSYDDDLSGEFYNPVLEKAVQYDRATAYFSAKSLANYGKGLEVFAKKGNKFRLIVSSELEEKDYIEIREGYRIRDDIRKRILIDLEQPISNEEKTNLSNLAYLISIGIIDIKIAFTKFGVFHDKFGVIRDSAGDIISFRGSNNETNAAYHLNFESFDITCSWLASEFDYTKITKSINTFNNLWENRFDNVFVSDIDDIIMEKLLTFNKGKIILDPIYLETNCLILDYVNNHLVLDIKVKPDIVWNSKIYKLRVKRYVDSDLSSTKSIVFKKHLTYPAFKKIIQIFELDSKERDYNFFTTRKLNLYIDERELHIEERSVIGSLIKNKSDKILDQFMEYKSIVDQEMERRLRDKQVWDSFFMCMLKKSANFSVPGSGKTSSVLGVYAYLNRKKAVEKIVVIGPKNSFGSWINEFSLSFGSKRALKQFEIHSHQGLNEKKLSIKYNSYGNNLYLFNYEGIHSLVEELSALIDSKTLLVFDEVHKIKALGGVRAMDALQVSRNSTYTIAMTGTPIPNSYSDLRNILDLLFHDEYGDFFGFSEEQLKNPSIHDIEEINRRISPFFCRTTKRELNVPEANKDIFVETLASVSENQIFNILIQKYSKNKLALIIRILQLESNPKMLLSAIDANGEDFREILDTSGTIEEYDYVDYSEDLKLLVNSIDKTKKFTSCIEQTIEICAMKETVIIWCIFVDSIVNLTQELVAKGVRAACIYGQTTKEDRELILDLFRNKKIDVLITNPHTLAESVSLHHTCHNAIYYEYSYNLVHLLQSKDRIHRLGLELNQYTQYYFMINKFTTRDNERYSLDKNIYDRLLDKEMIMLEAIENEKLEQLTDINQDIDIIFKELGLSENSQ